MDRILITGGAGFIGSSITDRLLAEGNFVRVIDNFDPYYDPKLKRSNIEDALKNKNYELVEGDITNPEHMKKVMEGIDCVIHEAAQPGVRISVENPLKTANVNIIGTLNVLLAAREAGIKKLVFASSSSVCGKVHYLPFDEKHPTEPISPYGVSKLACEHYCRVFADMYNMQISVVRYFTVYGPRMRPDLAINIFMHKAMANVQIDVLGDGTKSRDFTYIDDTVEGTLLALKKGRNEIYNIGGGNRVTVKEMLEKIIGISGSKSKIVYKEAVKADVDHTMADNTKAREQLGWQPKTKLENGLRKYYEWLKKFEY